jgi:predicted transcriptional regulator
MARRLVLNMAGIKRPLDLAAEPAPEMRTETPARPPSRSGAPSQRRVAARAPESPFYGTGRPRQTSVALDRDCADRLEHLARAAGVSATALAVAAVHAGLPTTAEQTRTLVIEERVARVGQRRVERNLRLPEHLRARVDELPAAIHAAVPRATRADLINAALRRQLPRDAERAAHVVHEHARRAERAAGEGG